MSELNTTSSIGAVWPPQEATQDRIRGFFTDQVLSSLGDVEQFAEQFTDARSLLSPDGASRLSLRAVVEPQTLPWLARAGVNLEAAIQLCTPVYGSRHADQLIIYAGHNLDTRRSQTGSVGDLAADAPANLLWRPQLQDRQEQISQHLSADLLSGEINAETSAEDRELMIDEFCDLYRTFGYDRTAVAELLANPDNHIVFIREEGGRILSTAMAETAKIDIGGMGKLVMAEITEASTRPEHRGQGLYRLASGLLISRLADRSHQAIEQGGAPINAIYGEGNMNMPGVLQAALQNGRRFSASDAAIFGDAFSPKVRRQQGLAPFGVLEQNFRVEDGIVAPGMYNNFALSYVTQTVMNTLLMYPRNRHDQLVNT